MNGRVENTIRLSGVDAVEFANSLFRPSVEEIENRRTILNRINESIDISRTIDGFEADIVDFDLSFLNNNGCGGDISINTDFTVNTSSQYFSEKATKRSSMVTINITNHYSGVVENEFLSCAA